jgi:hypothetical protein
MNDELLLPAPRARKRRQRARIALGFAVELDLEGMQFALSALDLLARAVLGVPQSFLGGMDGTLKSSTTRRHGRQG